MKRPLGSIALLTLLFLLAGSVAVASPGGVTTDHPSTPERADRARNLSLVGALELEPSGVLAQAGVASYRNLAFVGRYGGWTGPCAGSGVDIIDIGDPKNPVRIASTTAHTGTGMVGMEAIRIRSRDVLAVGLHPCLLVPGESLRGLQLFDITDPGQPQLLSFFEVAPDVPDNRGLYDLDLVRTPGGRTLALLAVPNLEAFSASPPDFVDGRGDLLIVDISDPTNPVLVGDWGVLAEPALGLDFYLGTQQGQGRATSLVSVRANGSGTRAYLSYRDAGHVILDITDPTDPVFLGRTEYPPDAEGSARAAVEARGGNLLIGTDDDFFPLQLAFRVTAPATLAGDYPAVEAVFTPEIADLPDQRIGGELVHIGRGCPPGTPGIDPAGDPYFDDPAGKIALIGRGACRFDNKIAWAQHHGAIGVIVYNNQPGLIVIAVDNPVLEGSPEVIGTELTIPAMNIEQTVGEAIIAELDAGGTVEVEAVAEFVGWGFLRIFDISDPADPVEIGMFASDSTFNPDLATTGWWTVHLAEVRGNTVYASWFNDGIRVVDISDPTDAHEIGSWTGQGAPENAPPVNIWGVVPHGDLILASDMNFGLYILKHTPEHPGRGR